MIEEYFHDMNNVLSAFKRGDQTMEIWATRGFHLEVQKLGTSCQLWPSRHHFLYNSHSSAVDYPMLEILISHYSVLLPCTFLSFI